MIKSFHKLLGIICELDDRQSENMFRLHQSTKSQGILRFVSNVAFHLWRAVFRHSHTKWYRLDELDRCVKHFCSVLSIYLFLFFSGFWIPNLAKKLGEIGRWLTETVEGGRREVRAERGVEGFIRLAQPIPNSSENEKANFYYLNFISLTVLHVLIQNHIDMRTERNKIERHIKRIKKKKKKEIKKPSWSYSKSSKPLADFKWVIKKCTF